MGTDVHFYNSIIGNFIVYQDRIETDLLKLCVQPENLEWFSVISVIIHEVNIVAKRKQAQLSNDSFVFYTFPLRSIILLPPPALPLLQHPWFHIFEHWTADVKNKISILLIQIIKRM